MPQMSPTHMFLMAVLTLGLYLTFSILVSMNNRGARTVK